MATRRGARHARVAAPGGEVVVGARDLEALQADPDAPSELDAVLIEAVADSEVPLTAFVFAGQRGDGCWRLDPTLSPEASRRLGYHLARSQLTLYRALVAAGISLCFGVAMGMAEAAALKTGTARLIEELEGGAAVGGATVEANLWVLRHLTFFTSASLDRVLAGTLAEKLLLCEGRAQRVRALLDG